MGGIIGYSGGGVAYFSNCYNNGEIIGNGNGVGGIVGYYPCEKSGVLL